MTPTAPGPADPTSVEEILDRVRSHTFHPVDKKSFTVDRDLNQEGIANLDDDDWRVRLLTVRDLVRRGETAASKIARRLTDDDGQVRYVCATALGVLGGHTAVGELERVVRDDPDALVRSQAIVALGQLESDRSLALLIDRKETDPSKDVRHQAELAIDRIEKGVGATDGLLAAYRGLDPETFDLLNVGDPAPPFALEDTEGRTWQLSDFGEDGEWTVLIWIFADWCPVCHTEFDELIELRETFADENVSVATVECHDRYRGRVMVGEEIEPEYWFSETSFQEEYTNRIWWPHLLDRAGAVGATYGVDPMAFAVHAEYVNRPATIIVDPAGTVRFAYYGTFWGDRPSIEETLELIRSNRFEYQHPERRQPTVE
ncbi:redoxin domain-containing protein [Halomontanus rarus]|uniref:redoxin domain-containing protein n=1 Tax=Halomontanus rarus TaxID=3034020 RepID=UPI0023E76C69|nr:redoxin domain-containing protein [Halovivax sp. TS33]